MDDQKDRFGQKLHDLEKAREDQWARERDQKLLEKIRHHQHAELHCPQCQAKLAAHTAGGVVVLRCPDGHGGWLDSEALHHLSAR